MNPLSGTFQPQMMEGLRDCIGEGEGARISYGKSRHPFLFAKRRLSNKKPPDSEKGNRRRRSKAYLGTKPPENTSTCQPKVTPVQSPARKIREGRDRRCIPYHHPLVLCVWHKLMGRMKTRPSGLDAERGHPLRWLSVIKVTCNHRRSEQARFSCCISTPRQAGPKHGAA